MDQVLITLKSYFDLWTSVTAVLLWDNALAPVLTWLILGFVIYILIPGNVAMEWISRGDQANPQADHP